MSFLLRCCRRHHVRYSDWSGGEISLKEQLRQSPPRFGHAILRSIVEAYYVLAVTLSELGEEPVTDVKKFAADLLQPGREMLLRRQINGESSISSDLYATGLQLAQHRRLLVDDGQNLAAGRKVFFDEVFEMLTAINLLQSNYNSAWFE